MVKLSVRETATVQRRTIKALWEQGVDPRSLSRIEWNAALTLTAADCKGVSVMGELSKPQLDAARARGWVL